MGKTPIRVALSLILSLLVCGAYLFFVGTKRLGQFDSGIGVTRALVASEFDFVRAHPGIGYTCVPSQVPRDGMTPKVSDSGESLYYSVEIRGCHGDQVHQPSTAFQILVRPRSKGLAAFCADQSGIVKYGSDGSAERCLQSGTPIG